MRIRAYNATGELNIRRDPVTLGTRVFLTCDVTGLSEENEVVSYRWYHKCTGRPNSRCEIRDGDPYYRVVNDTILVDVISWNQGGRYYCTVYGLQVTQRAITPQLSVAGWCTLSAKWCYGQYTNLTPLVPTKVTLFPSSTPPPPSSLSTLSSLMYNRQQGGMDNSG